MAAQAAGFETFFPATGYWGQHDLAFLATKQPSGAAWPFEYLS
jgi:hypothetical protein